MIRRLWGRYRSIPSNVLAAIAAVFMVNLSNMAFMLILNIYLKKLGYDDTVIASFVSYRFLGVLILGFPFGLFIRGRKLKPYLIAASLIVPIASLGILFVIPLKIEILIKFLFGLWGVGVMFSHVTILPFIMRNTPKDRISEAISLEFATWSMASIVAGVSISISVFIASRLELPFNEATALFGIIMITFSGLFFLIRLVEIKPKTEIQQGFRIKEIYHYYHWRRIIKASVPTIIIAVGAGLTIPFMNLFFYSVFNLDFDKFSILGSATAVVVAVSSLTIPIIRKKFGFSKTIIGSQIMGTFFLVMLAMTEIFVEYEWIIFLAFFAYLMRQPLMNMSGPVSSELTMDYVGESNQELISALQSSIWSASWFLSAKIFQILRHLDIAYYRIFLITAGMYSLGTLGYYFLIRDYKKIKAKG